MADDERPVAFSALTGRGFAYVYRHSVMNELGNGSLVETFGDWTPGAQEVSICYPDRRSSPAFEAFFLREC